MEKYIINCGTEIDATKAGEALRKLFIRLKESKEQENSLVCNWCNRKINDGIYITETLYCAMCASIINKNNNITINIDNINLPQVTNSEDFIKELKHFINTQTEHRTWI